MLLSSLADMAAPAVALLLAAVAAPLASAELRQGPTGVEYVKRFAASPVGTNCRYSCPTSVGGFQVYDEQGSEADVGGTPLTRCEYYDMDTGGYTCYYQDDGQLFPNGEVSSDSDCPQMAMNPPAGCGLPAKRTLSRLEEVIRSRQYNPRRRAAKRQ